MLNFEVKVGIAESLYCKFWRKGGKRVIEILSQSSIYLHASNLSFQKGDRNSQLIEYLIIWVWLKFSKRMKYNWRKVEN